MSWVRLDETEADETYTDKQQGKIVTYLRLCLRPRRCWLRSTGLTLAPIIRIQRTAEDPTTGEIKVGNRYYVSSKSPEELSAMSCLWISRGHWRVENETHWSADTQFLEDRKRHAWSRHPIGVVVVALLRMIAMNNRGRGPSAHPQRLQQGDPGRGDRSPSTSS